MQPLHVKMQPLQLQLCSPGSLRRAVCGLPSPGVGTASLLAQKPTPPCPTLHRSEHVHIHTCTRVCALPRDKLCMSPLPQAAGPGSPFWRGEFLSPWQRPHSSPPPQALPQEKQWLSPSSGGKQRSAQARAWCVPPPCFTSVLGLSRKQFPGPGTVARGLPWQLWGSNRLPHGGSQVRTGQVQARPQRSYEPSPIAPRRHPQPSGAWLGLLSLCQGSARKLGSASACLEKRCPLNASWFRGCQAQAGLWNWGSGSSHPQVLLAVQLPPPGHPLHPALQTGCTPTLGTSQGRTHEGSRVPVGNIPVPWL